MIQAIQNRIEAVTLADKIAEWPGLFRLEQQERWNRQSEVEFLSS